MASFLLPMRPPGGYRDLGYQQLGAARGRKLAGLSLYYPARLSSLGGAAMGFRRLARARRRISGSSCLAAQRPKESSGALAVVL